MKKTVAKNFFSLTFGEFVARFFSIFLTLYIARVLGAEGLGQFSFAMSVIAYFTFFTDFGLTLLGTREIASNKDKASKIGTNILFLQGLLAAVLVLIAFFLAGFISPDRTTRILIMVLALGLIPFALNLNYIFHAFQRMEFSALVKISIQFTYVLLAIIFLFVFKDITYAAISSVLGNLVGAVISIFIAVRRFNFSFRGLDLQLSKNLFIQSIPLGTSAFLVQLFFNFDTIAIGYLKGVVSVGIYSAAYKIMLTINSLGFAYFGSLFPIFSEKFSVGDLAKVRDIGEVSLRVLFFLAFPIVAGVVATAPLIMPIFGSEFDGSILVLQILIFNVVFIWLNNFLGGMLIADRRQKLELLGVSTAAVVNLVLNIVLIPVFGILAAAVVSVFSQIANFMVAYYFVSKRVNLNLFSTSYKSLVNSLLMYGLVTLFLMNSISGYKTLLAAVVLGAIFYMILSIITNNVPKQEAFLSYGKKMWLSRFGKS